MTPYVAYSHLVRRIPFLVCYWRLNDPVSATQANDSGARNNLNGFYALPPTPGPSLIEDDADAGSMLAGAGQSVSVPDAVPLRIIGSSISLMAWLAPAQLQSGVIVGKLSASGYPGAYSLSLLNGRLQLGLGDGTSSFASCLGPNVPIGAPSFVVGTLFRGLMSLYLDGQLVQTAHRGAQVLSDPHGALQISAGGLGNVAEVAVCDGALSARSVGRLFQVGRQVLGDAAHYTTVDPPVYA